MKSKSPRGAEKKNSLLKWIDKKDDGASQPIKMARYVLRLLFITIRQFNSNELSLRSGALTYTILLSLVPMLAMSTAIVKGLGGGDQLREAAYTYLDTLDTTQSPQTPLETQPENESVTPSSSGEKVPPQQNPTQDSENLTGHLRSAVDQLFNYVDRTNFATLGTFGVVGILLSVLLVLSHIESAMNAIWKVSSGRSPLRKVADYLTLLILFPLSINVAFAASAILKNPALSSKIDIFIPFDWIQALLFKAVPVFFIALSFYAMYIFFPNTKVKTLPALIGATLAAILWFAVQNVYITLQVGVAKYNAIYGSFATFPLFLVWIYLGWMFILTGAQVAFSLQNAHTFRLLPINSVPSLRLGAAFDIMEELYRCFENKRGVTPQTLPSLLPSYPQQLIEDVADQLLEADVIHLSKTDGRFLPLLPKDKFDSQTIVQTVLGKDAPDTTGGKRSIAAIEAASNTTAETN